MPTLLLALSVLLCGELPAAQAVKQSSSPVEFIDIDGKKNPELIPEYFAWRAALRYLSRRGNPSHASTESIRTGEMKISEAEFALILSYAARLANFEASQSKKFEAAMTELKATKADWKQTKAVGDEIEMDTRVETLRLADELLERLPPEAASNTRAWVAAGKANITVRVVKSEFAAYMRPR